MTISLSERVENTMGKGENAGYQHFLLFPVFSKAFFDVIKSRDSVVDLNCSLFSPPKRKSPELAGARTFWPQTFWPRPFGLDFLASKKGRVGRFGLYHVINKYICLWGIKANRIQILVKIT